MTVNDDENGINISHTEWSATAMTWQTSKEKLEKCLTDKDTGNNTHNVSGV